MTPPFLCAFISCAGFWKIDQLTSVKYFKGANIVTSRDAITRTMVIPMAELSSSSFFQLIYSGVWGISIPFRQLHSEYDWERFLLIHRLTGIVCPMPCDRLCSGKYVRT
jgi:hypothetical protein